MIRAAQTPRRFRANLTGYMRRHLQSTAGVNVRTPEDAIAFAQQFGRSVATSTLSVRWAHGTGIKLCLAHPPRASKGCTAGLHWSDLMLSAKGPLEPRTPC